MYPQFIKNDLLLKNLTETHYNLMLWFLQSLQHQNLFLGQMMET